MFPEDTIKTIFQEWCPTDEKSLKPIDVANALEIPLNYKPSLHGGIHDYSKKSLTSFKADYYIEQLQIKCNELHINFLDVVTYYDQDGNYILEDSDKGPNKI